MKGAYTAIVTPFNTLNHLDEKGLRQNIQYQIQEGIDGIVVLGTTGETPTLSGPEKKKVIQIAIEESNGRIPIIVGTGSYSTQQTIDSTQIAEELGASAALIVTPYYNKPTQEGLYQHFKAIAHSTRLPILLYNMQGRTAVNIQTPTLKRLAEIPNIIGIKEASGNMNQMMEVIECMTKHRPDFSILSGDDSLTLPLMALGGHGVISVVSNLIPALVVQLVQAAKKEDYVTARKIHYQLLPLFKGAFIETNPIPIKAAMSLCEMAAGSCRLPLTDLASENKEALVLILQEMGIANPSYASF